ncbi:unnamed protein product [Cunninghamella blakesleeana]
MKDYFTLRITILFSVLIAFVYAQEEMPGSPGVLTAPDKYNTFGVDWNRTYKSTEPQQIHISFGSDAKYVKIQFATIAPINSGILKYNEKKHPKRSIVVKQNDDFIFVDGGIAQRPLYLHNIQTKLLRPNTIYQYQVGAISEFGIEYSPIFEFHTAPRRDLFKFLAIGDVGINNAVTMKTLVEKTKTHQYDFITIGGDQGYDLADFNGTKGDEYMNFAQQIFSTMPVLAVVGNHEAAYNFSHYKNRFNILPYKESGADNPLFYSIDYKSIHLVSFSTEIYTEPNTPEQLQYALNWLETDLTKANQHREKRPWIIFMTHHPLYCSVTTNESCSTKALLIRNGPVDATGKASGGLEPILRKHKVDLYLAGHVHNYERTYPVANNTLLTKSYVNPPSFFHVVNGNAGQPEGTSVFSADLQANDWSAKRYDSYGFTEFTVTSNTLELTHYGVNIDGYEDRIIDRIKVVKNNKSSLK